MNIEELMEQAGVPEDIRDQIRNDPGALAILPGAQTVDEMVEIMMTIPEDELAVFAESVRELPFQLALKEESLSEAAHVFHSVGRSKQYQEVMSALARVIHERGLCHDPDCQYNKSKDSANEDDPYFFLNN